MNDVTGISSEAQKAIWRLKDRIAELEATVDDSQKMANSIIGDYDKRIAELEGWLAILKEQNAGAEALAIENVEMKERLEKARAAFEHEHNTETTDSFTFCGEALADLVIALSPADTALGENEEGKHEKDASDS